MNKNFIIVGTPRSGTTFLCDILSQLQGVWMPRYPNYEPFNPTVLMKVSVDLNSDIFDHDAIVKKFISMKNQKQCEYFGFKTFTGFHSDFKQLIRDNDLDVVIMLRKDFWKVVGSKLVAIDNGNYIGTSKRFKPFVFDKSIREKRRIKTFFNHLCRAYWLLENRMNDLKIIDKVYFEDLIIDPVRPKINEYFNRELKFDTGYNDNDSIYSYVSNFDELKSYLLEDVKKFKIHYGALPEYLLEQLEL